MTDKKGRLLCEKIAEQASLLAEYSKKTKQFLKKESFRISISVIKKSDRRGSNPRPPPWQGGVLPTVLLSHSLVAVCLSDEIYDSTG